MDMLFQNAVEVKSIEDQRRADGGAGEKWAKMFFKCAAFDTEVMRRLLAVVAALIHYKPPFDALR